MRRAVVLAVLTVLLAGCGGLGATTDGGGSVSVTPAPLPTQTPTSIGPGIDDGGVVDARALATTHTETLRTNSYTLSATRTIRDGDGTLRSRLELRLRLAANRTYLANVSTAGPDAPVLLGRPPARATYWSNGSLYIRAFTRDDRTVYNTFEPPDQYSGTWQYWARTVPFGGRGMLPSTFYMSVFRTVPTRTTGPPDDGPGVRLFGDGPVRTTNPAFSQEVDDVHDVELVATVDGQGVIRSLELSYRGTANGQAVLVDHTIRYRAIGRTVVDRPPWFQHALEN